MTSDDAPPPGPPAPPPASVDAAPDAPDAGDGDAWVDAGADADADHGGLAPAEAGAVLCGAQRCDVPQRFCCFDDPQAPRCAMIVTDSCTFYQYCDQSADCMPGEVCALGVGEASCYATAPSDAGILCGGSTDCESGSCLVTMCRGIRMRLCDGYCSP